MEVNRHLNALADSWERGGFPMHMNLAVRQTSAGIQQRPAIVSSFQNDVIDSRLKQQNLQLTEELGIKSERIASLERERQSLLRELVKSQRSKVTQHVTTNEEVIF